MNVDCSSNTAKSRLQMPRLVVRAIVCLISCGTAYAGSGVSAGHSRPTDNLLHTLLHERSGAAGLLFEEGNSYIVELATLTLFLSCFYGAAMGLAGGLRQTIASALKTPLVFLFTLTVCFPILHVGSVIVGLNLRVDQTATIVLAAMTLNALLLACFAPPAAFFGISSEYDFMKLLHVSVFAVCGIFSLCVLYNSLQVIVAQQELRRSMGSVLFMVWGIAYGFVGLQMAWTLRPFIGEPHLPFQWIRLRTKGMSVYRAIWLSCGKFGSVSEDVSAEDRMADCGNTIL